MKRITALLMAILMLTALLSSCNGKKSDVESEPEQEEERRTKSEESGETPLTVDELLSLGDKYLLELNYDQALVQFLAVIEIEPANPRGYTGAAKAEIGAGNFDGALYMLQNGFEQLPSNKNYAAMTIAIYESIIEKAPENPAAYIDLSAAFIILEHVVGAEDALRRGAESLPDNTEIRSKLEEFTETEPIKIPFAPLSFYFSSGVGGWGTGVTLDADGNFEGDYHDSDMGDVGDGYPNGTLYVCDFSGKFKDIRKISEYEYSMRIDYINVEEEPGVEKIVDGIRIISSSPYGFDNADEFRLYLPGRPTADLPQAFVDWVTMPRAMSALPATLDLFGLYNVGGEQGFGGDAYSEPPPEPTPPAAPVGRDVLSEMSKDERKALHTFFSNFSESEFKTFNINNYDENELIRYAISWNWINNTSQFAAEREVFSDGSDWPLGKFHTISSEQIDRTLTRFFGVTASNPSAYVDPDEYKYKYAPDTRDYYSGGSYYMFESYAGGAPWYWSQVTAFIDNADGTFTAYYDAYGGRPVLEDNIYADKSDWNSTEYDYDWYWLEYSCVAVVKPYNNNGRATYQLISLDLQ